MFVLYVLSTGEYIYIYELTWSIFPNRLRTPPQMTCARVNLKTCIARGLLFGLKGAAPFKAAPGGSTNVD